MAGFFAALQNFMPYALPVAGALYAMDANRKAQETALKATRANTQAVLTGQTQAQRRLDSLRAEGAPGVQHLQRIVAGEPDTLTPGQRYELADFTQGANRTATAGPFASSGRAVHAIVGKSRADLINRFMESNRNRRDQAAGQLAGRGASAALGSADLAMRGGEAVGAGALQAGEIGAGADVANATLAASGLGTLAGIISEDQNNKRTERRYQEVLERINPRSSWPDEAP